MHRLEFLGPNTQNWFHSSQTCDCANSILQNSTKNANANKSATFVFGLHCIRYYIVCLYHTNLYLYRLKLLGPNTINWLRSAQTWDFASLWSQNSTKNVISNKCVKIYNVLLTSNVSMHSLQFSAYLAGREAPSPFANFLPAQCVIAQRSKCMLTAVPSKNFLGRLKKKKLLVIF